MKVINVFLLFYQTMSKPTRETSYLAVHSQKKNFFFVSLSKTFASFLYMSLPFVILKHKYLICFSINVLFLCSYVIILLNFQISLLDTSQKKLTFPSQMNKTDIVKLKISVARFSAKALSSLCHFEANQKVACSSNIITICNYWVRSKHEQVIIPILILLQQLSVMVCI